MSIQSLISYFKDNSKRLFLIDGLDALLSAFMLSIILIEYNCLIGISKNSFF